MNHDDPIRRLATITDDEAARHVTDGTRADLAEQIMVTPSARARKRRSVLFAGAPLAAAAAGVAILVAWATTSGDTGHRSPARVQPAALTFSTSGKYLVVKVKDPYADPKRYAKEFAAHGMRISLRLVPVSPSIVGTVVATDGAEGIETITAKGKCWTGGGGFSCPVGVRIPISYQRGGTVVFGRPARPGEQYQSTTSAFASGEELHCVDIRGRTVAQALALLKQHRMAAAVFNYEARPGYFENTTDRTKIPDGWYVANADPWSPGHVMLGVQPAKPKPAEDDAYYHRMLRGCH